MAEVEVGLRADGGLREFGRMLLNPLNLTVLLILAAFGIGMMMGAARR